LFNYNPGDEGNPFGFHVGSEIHSVNGAISLYFADFPLTKFYRGNTYKFIIVYGPGTSSNGSEEDLEVLSAPLNNPASWGTGGGTYIGYSDQPASGTQFALVGVESPYAPDWNSIPEAQEGLSFEWFSNILDTVVIESICWEIYGVDNTPAASTKILRADGTLTENEPGPTAIVGGIPLGDQSDSTYIDFDHTGSIGSVMATCIALPPLVGYQLGDTISLHMRIQVFADAGFEGYGEFFIATDPGQSNNEIAGFSDGSGGGFSYSIGAEALGSIHEYTMPLQLGPWPTTLAELVSALEAGAFLDINALGWLNGANEPLYRLYEAWIEVAGESSPPLEVPGRLKVWTGAGWMNATVHEGEV